jgi:hypothetical protein
MSDVTVVLTWDEARALAYAAHGGLIYMKFPDDKYRETATTAREKLLEAGARNEMEVERAR